jgi:uncharacterized protein
MWKELSHFILRFRLLLILVLGCITIFMGYQARNLDMAYDFAQAVPPDDPEMVYFMEFKEVFGEDGNVVAIGFEDKKIRKLKTFRRFQYYTRELQKIRGVNVLISAANVELFSKNSAEKKFERTQFFPDDIEEQEDLDSLFRAFESIEMYQDQLINEDGAMIVIMTLDNKMVHTSDRDRLINEITEVSQTFSEYTEIKLHYAGIPYVRSAVANKVKQEFVLFLSISILVCALILLLFFRSLIAVTVPLIVIGTVVVWTMGTVVLLGYKMTLLTALLPPIIVVIGIPNSIYLINKFHQEFNRHGQKFLALERIIRKIGIVTLITNFTTAIGFAVLALTNIKILQEFGLVAGINIAATFVVSIILIPGIFSMLPSPKPKHLKHLGFKFINGFLDVCDILVHKYRKTVYILTLLVILISIYGMTKIEANSFMVDDLPENSSIIKDLEFFESSFSGIMPLEIVIDTGKKKGVQNIKNLKKTDELEAFLMELPGVSPPVSLTQFTKAANFAYYKESPGTFILPSKRDAVFLRKYLKNTGEGKDLLEAFTDSTGQRMRISLRVADFGSKKMDHLVNNIIQPKIREIFDGTELEAVITGTTLLFIKGNSYLIRNLMQTMVIAFFLIALIMAMLFQSVRMILISVIPNFIPLIISAGIMGYFGIPLKPSTALIFSIAFGISIDDSIHFLAKYRQELTQHDNFISRAVTISLHETGASMFYTSIVLFAGFIIFAFSDFGGTVALGILTSITLFNALIINLIFLPTLLLTFDKGVKIGKSHPLIEQYDEFYFEQEDEEIDLAQIEVDKKPHPFNRNS